MRNLCFALLGIVCSSAAFALPATPAEQSPIAAFLPLILIFFIFYFLIMRPQQKRFKDHQQMVKSLKKGDQVMTGGGIVGRVSKIDEADSLVHVEIADAVTVKVARATIVSIYSNEPKLPTATKKEKAEKPKKTSVANDN